MDNMLDDARERGLIEDLPDGGIRMKPELEWQMPMLYEIIREVQMEELQRDLGSLYEKGLIDLIGADETGFVYQVNEAGIEAVEQYRNG